MITFHTAGKPTKVADQRTLKHFFFYFERRVLTRKRGQQMMSPKELRFEHTRLS